MRDQFVVVEVKRRAAYSPHRRRQGASRGRPQIDQPRPVRQPDSWPHSVDCAPV